MPPRLNLTGVTFGRLRVIGNAGISRDGHAMFRCRCLCGAESIVCGNILRRRNGTRSCGCLKRRIPLTIIGQIFGRLTVLSEAESDGRRKVDCVCVCGTNVIVDLKRVLSGTTRSCGCLKREQQKTQHGLGKSVECRAWHNMIERCYDKEHPAFKDYGGRGIAVCDRWRQSFLLFYEDMGPRPSGKMSLDRIKNHLGYSKENCRWATWTTQHRNRRGNRLITFNGQTRCLSEWSSKYGIRLTTLCERLRVGWPLTEALTRRPNLANAQIRAAESPREASPNGRND